MDLLAITIEDLLLGRPPDREGWLSLASQLEEGQSIEGDVVVALARIATTQDSTGLDRLLDSIPATQKSPRAMGELLVASQLLDLLDPDSVVRLAIATYGILPYLGQRAIVQPALERLAELQARAMELGGARLDLRLACWFTNVANTLSQSLGNHRYLHAAFSLADRLDSLTGEQSQLEKGARYVTSSNLVTTCKQLAAQRPPEAERYLLRGVEIATYLYECRRELMRGPDAQMALPIVVQALRNLMFLHGELARVSPASSSQHIAAAWAHASLLRGLVEEHGDPDWRREAEMAERHLRERVDPLLSYSPAHEEPEHSFAAQLLAWVNEMARTSWVAAGRVMQLPAGVKRDRAIAEHLDSLYGELARRLAGAIREVGINRHVSMLLLGLGAIGSGRLWPLSFSAVLDNLASIQFSSEQAQSMWQRNQELPPRGFFDPAESYLGPVGELASFSDLLSSDEELAKSLKTLLHERSSRLLKDVLPVTQLQHTPNRRLSRIDDMAEIMTLVQGFGGPRQPAPRSETPIEPEGNAEAVAADAGPRRAAQSSQAGDARPEHEIIMDPAPDGSTKVVVDPEDMIGLTAHINGEPILFDSVLGKGRHKVVFGLTNLQTGRGTALAMARSSFSPEVRLQAHLERIFQGHETYEPDVVLPLCEAVLARRPFDWTAGVNKGNALVAKGVFSEAIDAFDVVLEGDPDDLYSLIYKAYALSCLGRHSIAVTLFARASDLYPNDFRKRLRHLGNVKKRLSASIQEVLHEQPDCIDAQQIARELSCDIEKDPAARSSDSGSSR